VLREDDIVIEPERPHERKCPRPEGRLAPARAADLDEFEIAQAPLALERGERTQNRPEVLARVLGADEEDVALVEQPPLDGPKPRVVDPFVHDEDPLLGDTQVADDVALGRLRDGDQRGRASDPGVVESESRRSRRFGRWMKTSRRVRSKKRIRSCTVTTYGRESKRP
jgi:hypothetical protein